MLTEPQKLSRLIEPADEYLLRKTVIENPYIPITPHPKQAIFLAMAEEEEVLYGGAAGGGKSIAILAAALQFAHVPGYAALLIRRTFADLNQPKALIPLSREWLGGKPGVRWEEKAHRWHFPNGATLSFGYLDNERDTDQFQGAEYNFCAFDELTQFPESRYAYLFSRLRKREGFPVPLRMRAGSNPGGIGHEWVRQRFLIEGPKCGRVFISAKLEDNPSLDRDSYEKTLARLDPVTRARLRHGDWAVRPEGNLFKRAWFDVVETAPPLKQIVRAWDMAATEQSQGNDPDYTAGAKLGLAEDGTVYVLDIIRLRGTPSDVQRVIKQTAMIDGKGVSVRLEQEPGSSGKALVEHFAREVLFGWDCRGVPASGDKVTRANPFSAACERRGVKLLMGEWISDFLDEITAFPVVAHDDQVDATVNAFAALSDAVEFDSGFFVLTGGN